MEAPVSNENTVVKEQPKVAAQPAVSSAQPLKAEQPLSDKDALKASVDTPPVSSAPPVVDAQPKAVESTPAVEETEAEKLANQRKLARRIEKLNQKASPQSQPAAVDTGDEVTDDQVKALIEEGRTFEAIKLVEDRAGKRVAKQLQQQMSQTQTSQQQQQEYNRIKSDSNKKVWEKYPEVLAIDELAMGGKVEEAQKLAKDTPIYKALGEVYEEKPHLQYLADGAEIALEIAERRLGIVEGTKKAKAEGVKQEAARAANVEAASVLAPAASAGASAQPAKAVNLTNDEKMVARKMGLTEEEYGANASRNPEARVRVVGQDYYKKYSGPVKRRA